MDTTDLCLDAMNMPPPDDEEDWDEEDDGPPEDEEDVTDEGGLTPPEDEDTEPPAGRPREAAWEGAWDATAPLAPAADPCLMAAIEYARRGWAVFPVHSVRDGHCTCGRSDCEHPGKHPRTRHGLNDASTDPDQIRRWWEQWPFANLGIPTGQESGFFVLDIDPRHGGNKSLAELEQQHGPLPPTLQQRTGGGGDHILFKHPGFKITNDNTGKLGAGLDVQGDGGCIVAAPSIHVSGGRYEWEPGGPPGAVPLADAPAWLLALLRDGRGGQKLETCAPWPRRLSERHRNSTLISIAGKLRRDGLSAEEIEAALQEVNRQRCDLPLPPEEVSKIARSAGRYEPSEDTDQSVLVPSFKSVRSLLADHPDLHPPVIDGLLRQGETLNIIAPPKRNKSWLAMSLGLAVATGRDWLGFPTRQGKVLILDNELHLATFANRIPRVANALGIDLMSVGDNLCVESLRGRLGDILQMAPYFDLLRPYGFKLIIIDSLYRFLPVGADENSNAGMAQVYNALDRYAQELGCAIVVIHHSSKGSQAGKALTDVGAGAGALARAADAHLILREHEVEGAVAVEAVTRSFPPPEPFCMRWDFPVWMLAPDLDPTLLRTSWVRRKTPPRAQEVEPKPEVTLDSYLNACASEPPCIADELLDEAARTLGLSRAEAKRWFNKARAAGRLHEWKFGAANKRKYATVPQPAAAP